MLIPLSQLSIFALTLAACYLLPGPDMALILSTAVMRGKRVGLRTALGLASARGVHVAVSGLGLAALLIAHPVLFESLRWLGAAYLLWLAWRIWAGDDKPVQDQDVAPRFHAFRRGLLTNLLNPKALMFNVLFLPQFVTPAHGHLLQQYVLLGLLLVIMGFVFDMIYIVAAQGLATRIAQSKRALRAQKAIFSSVFVLAACRLFVSDA